MNSAKAHLDRARRLSLLETRPVSTLIEQHTAVVDALEANNLADADSSLRLHLRGVFEDVQRIQEIHPGTLLRRRFSAADAPQSLARLA